MSPCWPGDPGAARAVGNIMRGCARPDVPCHRVIGAGGRLGGYGGNEALKRALLVAEGITIAGSSVRNLAAVRDSRIAAETTARAAHQVECELESRRAKRGASGKKG